MIKYSRQIVLEQHSFGGDTMAFSYKMCIRDSLLYDATLIWDNRILAVPSALISMPGHQMKKDTEETVVSTFGLSLIHI